jgi:hypothetical protein
MFSGLRLGGQFKSLDIHIQGPPKRGIPSGNASTNLLRLELTGKVRELFDFELSAENLLLYTDPAGLIPLPGPSVNHILDLEQSWNEAGRFADQFSFDRFNLQTTLLGVDCTLGRQAVGFGRIALFSPLDVIAPFPPDVLDADVRPGVDAMRAVHYFGLGGQIGGVAVFGDKPEYNSYLAIFSHNIKGVDLLGLTGQLRGRPMAGIGLAGSLGGLGLKGEIAAYEGKDVSKPDGDPHNSFSIGALETWYRFENDFVFIAQYLYNGAGMEEPKDYPRVVNSSPFQEGLNFLLGRHYLLAGPSYEAHPLVTLSGLLIWNMEDDSFLLRPLLDMSLSDNLVFQVFWAFNEGKKPERLFPSTIIPRSEFGSFGDSGGVFLKYFF